MDGWMGGWKGSRVKDCLQQSKIDKKWLAVKIFNCTKGIGVMVPLMNNIIFSACLIIG
jgi:hypothetical protein